ncbi:hypothetical protein R1sor_027311 [Riccia sorocarpa]|uniref:sphingosine kinase n=1 Tax=Riccia sorocarpa TaxID=122646 RepID=A0ABD3GEK7_9MARC
MDTIKESVLLDGKKVSATVSVSGLLQWESETLGWHENAKGAVDLREDVIGYSVGSSSIVIHTFVQKAVKCWENSKRVERDITLVFNSPDSQQEWCNVLQRFYRNAGRPKRLFVLVNPFGGKNKALNVYHKTVEPLFKKAGIDVTIRETQFHRHAKELAKSLVLSEYDGVVCVSGDGVLTEVLNGLLERPDWEQAIKMPLGIIPAGTGNGMAKSLLEAGSEYYNQANAAFAIIRGCKQPLDIASVVQGHVKCHSMLMLSWGFVADVDFESEKIRSLGSLRIDLWAVIRVLWLREYSGSLAYLPATESDIVGERLSSQEQSLLEKSGDSDRDTDYRKESNWRTLEGKFIYIWAQNVPYAAEDVIAAPRAKFNDGSFDLIVIRQCPRLKLVSILLNMKNGSHIKSKYVQYLKVKAFRLTPGGIVGDSIEGGYVDLDGEVLARGQGAYGDGSRDPMHYGPAIDVNVEKGLATIFAPARCIE